MTSFAAARDELDRDTILFAKLPYSPDEFSPCHRSSIGHFCPNVKADFPGNFGKNTMRGWQPNA
jgi:hypothetical protein